MTDGKSEVENHDFQGPVLRLLLEDNLVKIEILYDHLTNNKQLRGIIGFCGSHTFSICII